MSASDIKPENIDKWLQYAERKRSQADGQHTHLAECELGHPDCAPVWGGTCPREVRIRRRLARLLALSAAIAALSGCATPPGRPYGVWDGGMRGPDNEACSMRTVDGVTELVRCAPGTRP